MSKKEHNCNVINKPM